MSRMTAKGTALVLVTLASVLLAYAALWKNVTKRLDVIRSATLAAEKHPDYAPALIKANDIALGAYATQEMGRLMAEGALEFSGGEAVLIKKRAERALVRAPLQVKALTQIATADFLKQANWSDREILQLAMSRNARDRQTLMALSTMNVRAGNFGELLDLFDLRYRLGNLDEVDLQVVKGLSTLPEQRSLIEEKLANVPSWGEVYFRSAIPDWDAQSLQDNSSSLFIFLSAQDDDHVRQNLLQMYFMQLRHLALYDQALEAWLVLPEVRASGKKIQPIYNSDFKYLSAPQPFNWQTYENNLALAEVEPVGGLYASSSSPKRSLIAHQLITAPTAQALRFEMEGSWQYREQQGYFFWRLSCMPSGSPFYDIKIGDSAKQDKKLSFNIPPLPDHCKFQDMQLNAQPSEFNQRVTIRIKKIDILPRALTEAERQSKDMTIHSSFEMNTP